MTERRKAPPWVRVAVFVAVLAVILAALVAVPLAVGMSQPRTASQPDPHRRVLRVSRGELFTGEAKRLEPHLGLTASGCVRLEPINLEREVYIGMRYEIRRAGEPPEWLGECISQVRRPSEASFSLRGITNADPTTRYELVTATGGETGGTGTTYLRKIFPDSKVGEFHPLSPLTFEGPREFGEREEVPVWAYVMYENGHAEPDLETALTKCRCALVVSLWWQSQYE